MRSLEWVNFILKTQERSWNTQNNLEFQEARTLLPHSKISNINICIIPGHFYLLKEEKPHSPEKPVLALVSCDCKFWGQRRNQPISSEESGGDQLKQCKDPAVDGGWTYAWRMPVLSRKESAFPGLWLQLPFLLPFPQGQPSPPTHPPASTSSVSSTRQCLWMRKR